MKIKVKLSIGMVLLAVGYLRPAFAEEKCESTSTPCTDIVSGAERTCLTTICRDENGNITRQKTTVFERQGNGGSSEPKTPSQPKQGVLPALPSKSHN